MIKDDIDIFRGNSIFVKGVVDIKDLPSEQLPHIAFWGRSNAGKSSLLNGILFRKKLVKSSKTPGKTREINFFKLSDKIFFIDLPGYGYARVSKVQKYKWSQYVLDYLLYSTNLKRLFLLIDAKVGIKDLDIDRMNFLDKSGILYQIIITKIDRISQEQLDVLVQNIQISITDVRPACYPKLLFSSVKEKIGLLDIRQQILDCIL